MARDPATPFSFPSDLWAEYEEVCNAKNVRPVPALRLHVMDYLDHPRELSKAVIAALTRERPDEDPPKVAKAGRWPPEVLGRASRLAQTLHISRDAFFRLVMEGVVANSHPTRATKTKL